MEIMKVFCLFLAVWFTLVNTIRVIGRSNIPAINIILHAIGITGFVYLQWLANG